MRYSRLGVTGVFSIAALVVIVIAGAILDLRAENADVRRLLAAARTERLAPVDAIVAGGRTHRFVFLADVPGSAGPKKLAAAAIEALATGPGLDAVVLEVGRDQQEHLDAYFNTEPENASVLLAQPSVVRSSFGDDRAFLELYHRIWQLNAELGPDRRVRVVAADLENWGESAALSPAELARDYAARSEALLRTTEEKVLALSSRARVLVLVSGLQALRSGYAQLQTGGTATVEAPWFAARLSQFYPGEVFSVLLDAPGRPSRGFVEYAGTRLDEVTRDGMPAGEYALRIDEKFDFLSNPVVERPAPGVNFSIAPRNYRLHDVADLYVHLER